MIFKLDSLGPVCCEDKGNATHWRMPNPSFFSNIILLREFLNLVVQDWDRAVKPYQDEIAECEDENQEIFTLARGFGGALQTQFLKCLFSYVFFFVSLEGAYESFYSQLNKINEKPFLRVKHQKRPKPSFYIKKVRIVRSLAIAHIGSTKGKEVDLAAAIMWQQLSIRKSAEESWDLNKMCFGGVSLHFKDIDGNVIEESSDMEIEGIHELNTECMDYIKQFDEVCYTYLKHIHERLPKYVGEEYFYEFKNAT